MTPPLVPISAPDLQYSSLEAGLKFSPKRAKAENETSEAEEETLSASLGLGRIAGRNLDLCYFLGNDFFMTFITFMTLWHDILDIHDIQVMTSSPATCPATPTGGTAPMRASTGESF